MLPDDETDAKMAATVALVEKEKPVTACVQPELPEPPVDEARTMYGEVYAAVRTSGMGARGAAAALKLPDAAVVP